MSRTRIVEGITNKTTQGEHSIYSDGKINLISNEKVTLKGYEGGVKMTSDAQQAPTIQPRFIDNAVVYFRPGSQNEGEYGFDWLKLGERGDPNFMDICGKYNEDGTKFEKNRNEYFKLEKEYAPLFIRGIKKANKSDNVNKEGSVILPDGSKTPDVFARYYTPWLTIYPPNVCESALSTVNLTLDIKAEKKLEQAIYFECDTADLFDITPTIAPINSKAKRLKDGFTITCKKEFNQKQEIRAYLLPDANDESNKQVIGRLFVLPNDRAHRFSLPVRFVQVWMKEGDTEYFQTLVNDIKTEIKKWLSQGVMHQVLIDPQVAQTFEVLNLTAKYKSRYFDSYITDNPDTSYYKGGSKVIGKKENDTTYTSRSGDFFDEIIAFYRAEHPDEYDGIVMFFINYDAIGSYSVNNNVINKNINKGIAQHYGRYCLMYTSGVDKYTVTHETMHTLGLAHSFDNSEIRQGYDRELGSKYTFEKSKTDNIMDYSAVNGSDSQFIYTYKWQWDQIWNTQQGKIIADNEK